ncbi:MAG TPA: AAA family ATPase [Kofleriaceae bacterium]|jgi:dethiobiotin synthase
MRQYFVTGTDTGVGKTHVATALARLARTRGQRVFAFKPMETGCLMRGGRRVGPDQIALVEAAGGWQTGDLAGIYQFEQAAAPFVAARRETTEIDLERIVRVYRDGLGQLLGAPPAPPEEPAGSLPFDAAGDTILGVGDYQGMGAGSFRSAESGASGSFRVPDGRSFDSSGVPQPTKREGSGGIATGRTRTTDRVRMSDLGIADGLSGRRRSRELSVPVRLTTPALGILATDPLYEHYLDGNELPGSEAPDVAVEPGLCLVEGAGGWRVPVTRTSGMAGLARRIGAPVIIVARATLGTLNHSLLTIEAVERDGLRVAALVLSGLPADDRAFGASNAAELRRMWRGQVVELWNDPSVLANLVD